MPSPQIPDVRLVRNCVFDAIVIGIVAFAQSVSMAKIFAKKNGYKIDSNQVNTKCLKAKTSHKGYNI